MIKKKFGRVDVWTGQVTIFIILIKNNLLDRIECDHDCYNA